MKKRLLCAALALYLSLSLALAAGTEEKFPAVNTYSGYADVQETDWFYQNAKLCYETGLMTGTDVGFEPGKNLTQAEAVVLAARVGAAIKGDTLRPLQQGEDWWLPYEEYVLGGEYLSAPADFAFRLQFVSLLDMVLPEELLMPINNISLNDIPDNDPTIDRSEYGETALRFYQAGILTGRDTYGSFGPTYSLTRAEAAAMVSRIVRPELRLTFTPADYSSFTAAYLTPDTVMFDTGATAEEFLKWVNARIFQAEEAAMVEGVEFNWHNILGGTDKTYLAWVKAQVLEDLEVTSKQGTQAYKDFDYQVYYSRLIDLTGKPLQPDYAVKPGGLPQAADFTVSNSK